MPQVGLTYVRGCEVEGMLDEGGRVIEDGPDPRPVLPGERRTFRVWLDCNQYRQDLDNNAQGKEVSRRRDGGGGGGCRRALAKVAKLSMCGVIKPRWISVNLSKFSSAFGFS